MPEKFDQIDKAETALNNSELLANKPTSPQSIERQSQWLLVVMVLIGYFMTFYVTDTEYAEGYTVPELFYGILLGVFYLALGLNNRPLYRTLPAGAANAVLFLVQLSLVFGIGWILGPIGIWLIGIPLAAIAVERLTPKMRWWVYLGLILAIILPIGLKFSTWGTAFNNALIIGAAVGFTAIFSQMHFNEQIARQKAERLARELEQKNLQLANYAAQAEELATTQERNRLAREIHDTLGHHLTIIHVQIEAAKVLMESDPSRALGAMTKAQTLTQKGLQRVGESVAALRESPLSNRSLEATIQEMADETQATGILTDFKVLGKTFPIEDKAALALYRMAQEALPNVCRHNPNPTAIFPLTLSWKYDLIPQSWRST